MRILAGDIGGTNTRLSLWEREDHANPSTTPHQVGGIAKFKNKDFASFDAILDRYLAETSAAHTAGGITDACLGVAGPVDGRNVRLTNIPHWPGISADVLAKTAKIAGANRATLINDMPAHGASIASIETIAIDHVLPIHAGEPRHAGMRAIVMPGTGLGVGMLAWDERGKLHRPLPTEAGHTDIAERDAETSALVASMRKLYPDTTITREHLVSGRGMRAMYACLKNPAAPNVDAAPMAEDLLKLEAGDPVAKKTLDLFAKLLGEMCGNVAFNCLATGGIYLAGSIAASLRGRLSTDTFIDAFRRTGPASMKQLIESIPVKLVIYEETGLLGAATYASWVADGRI